MFRSFDGPLVSELQPGQLKMLRSALDDAKHDVWSPLTEASWCCAYLTGFNSWAGLDYPEAKCDPTETLEARHERNLAEKAEIEGLAREAWAEMGGKPEHFVSFRELVRRYYERLEPVRAGPKPPRPHIGRGPDCACKRCREFFHTRMTPAEWQRRNANG